MYFNKTNINYTCTNLYGCNEKINLMDQSIDLFKDGQKYHILEKQ
jgi:hypothetical protein